MKARGWTPGLISTANLRDYGIKWKRAQVTGSMSARETIISQFRQIAQEQKLRLAPLTDDLVLLESGFDSLSFAILVARLEDTLGVDPFSVPDDVKFPITLAEFIRSYEEMLPGGQVTSRSIGSS